MAKQQVFGPILAHLLQIPDGRTDGRELFHRMLAD